MAPDDKRLRAGRPGAKACGSAGQSKNTTTPISVCLDTGSRQQKRKSKIHMVEAALPYAVPFHSEAARKARGNMMDRNIPVPTKPNRARVSNKSE
jgi:hypothetical protein